MKRWGIDVSRWQGEYDFARAKKEGVQFVILKAGGSDGGLYTDACFETNYNKCKSIGLPVGAYFYSVATNASSAKKEAEYLVKLLKGKTLEYPIWMDVEDEAQIYIGQDALTSVVATFLDTLTKKDYFAGLYTFKWCLDGCMHSDKLKEYPKWFTHYSASISYDADMWQYGGSINLIRNVNVAGQMTDQSYCFRDFPDEIINGGYNGYMKNGWKLELKGWCYYENGKKLTNSWKQDSKGWCYLGKDGYCVKNKWQKDGKDWCYIGANGYMATNEWVKDSVGWCYVSYDGRIVKDIDATPTALDKSGRLCLVQGKKKIIV